MKTKAILIAMTISTGSLLEPVASAHDAVATPGYFYPPYSHYGGSNRNSFEERSFFGDNRGAGRGSGKGEAEFSMSISGKGSGEQSREGSFGSSSYGGSNNYAPYRNPAVY